MKGKTRIAGALFIWAVCLLPGGVLDLCWGQAQRQPRAPAESAVASKEARASSLKWKDEEQKKSCEARARQIREHFLKAREFSIQGDSCSSEQEAGNFALKLQELKKDCPEGFAEHWGFTPKVVRNVKTLQSLGKERCGKPGPQSPKAKP